MSASGHAGVRQAVQCVCLSVRELGVREVTWDLLNKAAGGDVAVRRCMRVMHMHMVGA